MVVLYFIGFVVLVAFLIWANDKLEAINERNEQEMRQKGQK